MTASRNAGIGHFVMPSELEKWVAAYRKNGDERTKEKIRVFAEKMITEWVTRWEVFEWDVINEPRGKHAVQDILGEDVMVEWFDIARRRAVDSKCVLMVNENRVISDPKPGVKTANTER